MPSTAANRFAALATAAAVALTAAAALAPDRAEAAVGTWATGVECPIGSLRAFPQGGSLTINDAVFAESPATPYPSSVSVTGLAGPIIDVNLAINGFSHGRPSDVDVMLVAPTGEHAIVMADVGATESVSGLSLTLDDDASAPLPTGAALTSGSFRPTNGADYDYFHPPAPSAVGSPTSLATFNGLGGNGNWKLFVEDDQKYNAGSIASWSLDIVTAAENDPSTITVTSAAGPVTDVDVRLAGLFHGQADEVDLLLVGPRGQRATILSDVGGNHPAQVSELVLDDEAAAPLSSDALQAGSYRPTNAPELVDPFPAGAPVVTGASALSAFDGTDPNGVWKLYLADDEFLDDHGRLEGWSLRITTADPVPTPTPTPTAGGTGGDTAGPRVASTRPVTGAKAVRRGADLTATFTEAVRRATVTRSSAYLVRKGSAKHLAATVTYRAASKQAVIDPAKRLHAGTTYRVVVTTAIKDLAGNRLDQNPAKAGLQAKTWRFTTR